jgi:predicted dehydrogenase
MTHSACNQKVSNTLPFLLIAMFTLFYSNLFADRQVRYAVAGLSHGHVDWAFSKGNPQNMILVGIYETNAELVEHYAKRYSLDRKLFYSDLNQMLVEAKPEAVTAFGPIVDHLKVVRACAPKGVHVMVEKPLATTLADAQEIQKLALKYKIHVLTNFETSWYASNQYLNKLVQEGTLGNIRKVMVNDGHEGPQEIGVSKSFFSFLTDPVQNGGGAIMDFGCYGANLMTWLLNGEKPVSVTAVTNQNKPHIYQQVDDEATIILQYPKLQCIIQGSWNWSYSRKDMEIYGDKGYAIAVDPTSIRQRIGKNSQEQAFKIDPRPIPFTNPFAVLSEVVQGNLTLDQNDLYGLPVNVVAVEILEAAKKSAQSGKTIRLSK